MTFCEVNVAPFNIVQWLSYALVAKLLPSFKERQIDYGRTLYREDLPALKEKMKLSKGEQEKEDNVPRQKPPSQGLKLEFVFG